MSAMQLLPMPDRPSDVEAQRDAARATYTMYRSYVDAGFDKHQAMQIVLELFRASLAQSPKRPS
jgi:hypothetical protein